MDEYDDLILKTREEAYVTLVKMCKAGDVPHELRLGAAQTLLAATERDFMLRHYQEQELEQEPELALVPDDS